MSVKDKGNRSSLMGTKHKKSTQEEVGRRISSVGFF